MLDFLVLASTSINTQAPNPFHIAAVEEDLQRTLKFENYAEEEIIWPKWSKDPVGLRMSFDFSFDVRYPVKQVPFIFSLGDSFQLEAFRIRDAKGEYLKWETTHRDKQRMVIDLYPPFLHSYLTKLDRLEMPPMICYEETEAVAVAPNATLKVNAWRFDLTEQSVLGLILTLASHPFTEVKDLDFKNRFETFLNANSKITKSPNFVPGLFKSFPTSQSGKVGFFNCPQKGYENLKCFCSM